MNTQAPLLVLGWGNPGRGDDALGPLLVERLLAQAGDLVDRGVLQGLTDFQLQIEHALDLAGRRHVLFVDAARDLAEPFVVRTLAPHAAPTPFTHALAPEALLHVAERLHGHPPPATLLALRAHRFDFGAALTDAATQALQAGLAWALAWLRAQAASAAGCGSRGSA